MKKADSPCVIHNTDLDCVISRNTASKSQCTVLDKLSLMLRLLHYSFFAPYGVGDSATILAFVSTCGYSITFEPFFWS